MSRVPVSALSSPAPVVIEHRFEPNQPAERPRTEVVTTTPKPRPKRGRR